MIELKKFNEEGMNVFWNFIERTREQERGGGTKIQLPDYVYDANLTEDYSNVLIDESRVFSDRYELGTYLISCSKNIIKDFSVSGLWAWIAAIYFEQIRSKARRRPSTQRQEHFIPHEFRKLAINANLSYRHAIRHPVLILTNYDAEWGKFLLTGRPVHEMGDPVEHSTSNKKIYSRPYSRELFLKLYQDPQTYSAKKGAFSQVSKNRKSLMGKGGARRMIKNIIPRLKKSFDVEVMDPDQIINVCGPEIKTSKWVTGS